MNTKLIVGLGNPGSQYALTRHNIGFLVAEKIAEQHKLKFTKSSFSNGLVAEGDIDGCSVMLLMPSTFMNNSGQAVKSVVLHKQIDPNDMLVITDDYQLDFGQLRLKTKGSDGGHNGLASIIEHLGSIQFGRLRVGIGQPKANQDAVDYVLGVFTKQEQKELDLFVNEAADCCLRWAKDGAQRAMEVFNRRKE